MGPMEAFTGPLPPLTLSPSADSGGELPEGTKDKLSLQLGLVNLFGPQEWPLVLPRAAVG